MKNERIQIFYLNPPRSVITVFLTDHAISSARLKQPKPDIHMSQATVVKVENGLVRVYNSSGSGLHSFTVGGADSQAVSAVIVGDEVHVTRKEGYTVICTIYGSQKRLIK